VTHAAGTWVDRWLAPEKLAPRAAGLVRRCWLAALGITVVFAPFALYAGEIIYFFPYHRLVPPLRALVVTLQVALLYALACALIASVLLAFRRTRGIAGLVAFSPVPISALLVIGYLAFGIWPGPSHFVRYVGMQRYRVPWTYEPSGSEEPGPKSSFGLRVYSPDFTPFLEGPTAGFNTRLYLRPTKQDALAEDFDRWRNWLGPVDEGLAFGLHRLASSDPSKGAPLLATSPLYYSRDARGSIVRLIVCNQVGTCEERLLVGNLQYRIEYPAEDIEHWQSFEERTIALFASFRVPADSPEISD